MTLLLKSKNAWNKRKETILIIITHGNPMPAFLGVTEAIFLELKTFMFHGFGVQKG